MNDIGSKIQQLPIVLPALILSLVLHELAHAYVAHFLGDRTPKEQGRLTLNPIKHLDPFGSGLFLFTFLFTSFPFGWAKPVQINPRNLWHHQRGMAVVAVAGPLVNFGLALGFAAYMLHAGFDYIGGQFFYDGGMSEYWLSVLFTCFQVNVVLGVFNLFPIPPLDGSRIVGAFMPKRMYEDWSKLDQYAPIFLIVLLVFLRDPFTEVLGDASGRVTDLIFRIVGG